MSFAPAALRRLMRELNELRKNPPEGIRIQTNEDDMLDVTGIIEGPEGTPYAGGYFRVKFKFTEEFPAAPPQCRMITKIFHPNVSGAGEICVNTLKKDWKAEYGIAHILTTVKCLLIYPNPESALDEEAGKLLLENYDSYCDRAKLITSVHARSRTKPAEFDASSTEPSSSSAPAVKSSSSSTSLPTVTRTATINASKGSILPPSAALSKTTSPAILPSPSQPLKNSLSNKESLVAETRTPPTPLSTANSNIPTTPIVEPTEPLARLPVKRAAPSTMSAAEKRKKALKRL